MQLVAGMFTDAFTSDLGDFGNVEERGIIDSSSITMTSYFGENAAGGATAITVGSAPVVDEEEDAPRTPPWERSADPLLSTPTLTTPESSAPESPVNEEVEAATDLLAFSKQVTQADSQPEPEVLVAATPPPLPPAKPTGPPTESAPPDPPSCHQLSPNNLQSPPTGPPSSPPTRPSLKSTNRSTSGPPSGPPSKPPSGPPSGPPVVRHLAHHPGLHPDRRLAPQ